MRKGQSGKGTEQEEDGARERHLEKQGERNTGREREYMREEQS